MRPGADRERVPIAARSRLLIVCEGKATEVGYFEAIRTDLRLRKERLIVVHPDVTDPRSLVRAARDRAAQYRRERTWGAGDQVWAVFDGDEHKLNNPENWNDALQIAGNQDGTPAVRLAISNPCFELWYLLHYQAQNSELHRDAARASLRQHCPDYEKNAKLWPKPLKPRFSGARNRADTLAALAGRDGRDRYSNPYTGVHRLVAEILNMQSPRY